MRSCRFLSRITVSAGLCCALFASAQAQTNYQALRSFGVAELSGNNPLARLLLASDGALYGTTYLGGTNNLGTVFKVGTNGSGYLVLHHFTGNTNDGNSPMAGLLEGTNGLLYGTSCFGGNSNLGTVFALDKSGSNFAVLKSFTGGTGDGSNPRADLLAASDGAWYGTTASGGTSNLGTIFTLSASGSSFTLLKSFTGTNGDGSRPVSSLVEGTNGALFGTTCSGGSSNCGTVFQIGKDGSNYAVLKFFTKTNTSGRNPYGGLRVGSDGALYGTTRLGGATNVGTIFKLNHDGSGYTIIRSLTNSLEGSFPQGQLLEGGDGALYGTTYAGGTTNLGTVFKLNKDGSGYTVLRNFLGGYSDGDAPAAGPVQSGDGTLFGITYGGGINNYGTIFALNTNGGGAVLVKKFNAGGGDGRFPNSTVQGTDGMIYGTTESGGSDDLGTVFKLNRDGSGYALLHSFTVTNNDGRYPLGLTQASDGMLYGTTYSGGSTNWGTVFALDTNDGSYSVLKHFTGDGITPAAGVIEGSDGLLYGLTRYAFTNGNGTAFKLNKNGSGFSKFFNFSLTPSRGGLLQASDGALYGTSETGDGTVFKLNTNGTGFTSLRSFAGNPDGSVPWTGVMEGSDGALYGTTTSGGTNDLGTIFKLDKNGGNYVVLYRFTGTNGDGANPWSGLVERNDGALYGATESGGSNKFGTVFKINKNGGGYVVLTRFTGGSGGSNPEADLTKGSDGALYGAASVEGVTGAGAAFKLLPPLVLTRIETSGADRLLSLVGAYGQTYRIQATTNLALPFWESIGTNAVSANGLSQFLDTGASNYPVRFYQSITP